MCAPFFFDDYGSGERSFVIAEDAVDEAFQSFTKTVSRAMTKR